MTAIADKYSIRIIGYGMEKPDQLLANPMNWRVHPEEQRNMLTHILERYGIVQNVVVNKRTGHVIDGHLRVSIAMQQGIPELPVTYIDVGEKDERAILAAFDANGAMALCDTTMFSVLVADISTFDPDLSAQLETISLNDLHDGGSARGPEPGDTDEKYDVVVSLNTERAQSKFVHEMKRRGFRCRTVRQ